MGQWVVERAAKFVLDLGAVARAGRSLLAITDQ